MTSCDKHVFGRTQACHEKIEFNLLTQVSQINSLTIFRVQMLVVPPYIRGFWCTMDQNVSNCLLYTHTNISENQFCDRSQVFSETVTYIYMCTCMYLYMRRPYKVASVWLGTWFVIFVLQIHKNILKYLYTYNYTLFEWAKICW